MTTPNSAAWPANENPLSDEYVNTIIQRHGYDSPETVIARLAQWIGLHGGENDLTLLMYEAHKALSKLRAPVADTLPLEAALHVLVDKIVPGLDTGDLVHDAGRASAMLSGIMASAPVAGQEVALELRGVPETIKEGGGFWRSCTGCHELNEGRDTGPYSAVLGCHLGQGCGECGGIGAIWDSTDYQTMADSMARDMGQSVSAAPLASVPVATEDGYRLVPTEPTHAMLQALSGEWHSSKHEQARANYSAMLKAAPMASVPAAGEAVYTLRVRGAIQAWTPTAAAFSIPDGEHQLFLSPAAPQASAEDVHNAALEQAAAALEDHRKTGREWVPGSLWDTLSREAAARIRALKQPQADKDGEQLAPALPDCEGPLCAPGLHHPLCHQGWDADAERQAWEKDMAAAGAEDLGDGCWEWREDDFEFHLWQIAVRQRQRDTLLSVLGRLNSNPYNLMKYECVDLVREMFNKANAALHQAGLAKATKNGGNHG